MQSTISLVFGALKFSLSTIKNNFFKFILLTIAFIFLLIISRLLISILATNSNVYLNLIRRLIVVIYVIYVIFNIGLNKKNPFKIGKDFLNYFSTYLLYILLVGLGLILFIVPGVYFCVKYCVAPLFAIDKNLNVALNFLESSKLTYGYKWKILFLILLFSIIASIRGLQLAYIILGPQSGGDKAFAHGLIVLYSFIILFWISLIILKLSFVYIYKELKKA